MTKEELQPNPLITEKDLLDCIGASCRILGNKKGVYSNSQKMMAYRALIEDLDDLKGRMKAKYPEFERIRLSHERS